MKNLSISILNVKNVSEFLDELSRNIEVIKSNKKREILDTSIHFDVMDNKFVPNTGVELENMKCVKEHGYYFDAHFMVEKPVEDGYIDKAIEYGCTDITIHYEIENLDNAIDYLLKKKKELNGNLRIGICIKPTTDINVLKKYKNKIDKILVMSVEPGFGGQKFIPSTIDKLEILRKEYKDKFIQVDGGVNSDNFRLNVNSGVDSAVVGAYITSDTSKMLDNLVLLNVIRNIEELPKEASEEFESKILQIKPNGYGNGDILLKIRVPTLRKLEKMWYNIISRDALKFIISSNIHDYRRFAVFCLADMVNSKNSNEIKMFIDENIEYINNWDLVDSCAPICIGKQLLNKSDNEIYSVLSKYTKSSKIWTKRIGIVSMLYIAKANRKEAVFKVLDDVFFEEFHLYQKATGWVLRELYKVNPKDTLEYLIEKKKIKKIPNILKSYATERMSIKERNKLK